MTHWLDKSIDRLFWIGYVFFVMATLTASFGVALSSVATVLLFGSGLLLIYRARCWQRLLKIELIGLCLFFWLCLNDLIALELTGLMSIVSEYRFLWLAPIVAIAFSASSYRQFIWVPIIVGLVFYSLGSVQLTLLGDPFEIGAYKRSIQNSHQNHLSLGGKFVHGLIATIVVSVSLFKVANGGSWRSILGWSALALGFTGYTLLIENGRTGYILVILAWLISGAFLLSNAHHWQFKLVFFFGVMGSIAIYSLSETVHGQVGRIFIAVDQVYNDGNFSSSTGQRLQGFKNLLELDNNELLFGSGYERGSQHMRAWIKEGIFIGEPTKNLNMHSDIAHLVLYGGLIALILYVAFAYQFWLISRIAMVEGDGLLAGLTCGVFIALFVSGILNSTLMDLRERNVVLLGYILILIYSRLLFGKKGA